MGLEKGVSCAGQSWPAQGSGGESREEVGGRHFWVKGGQVVGGQADEEQKAMLGP